MTSVRGVSMLTTKLDAYYYDWKTQQIHAIQAAKTQKLKSKVFPTFISYQGLEALVIQFHASQYSKSEIFAPCKETNMVLANPSYHQLEKTLGLEIINALILGTTLPAVLFSS
ncbi:hypothetical protein VNO77_02774 [Canavalia gladiata]|uniref:Uncharacterized protein n=1 Tax=Canavalia gladiata TaxID=3824 RepID=A0AAN9MU86_CANGL